MQKEKSIGRNILIVVLILVTIASVCVGLFAWAKYQSTINGTATGETAKWSFKVSDGNTSTQEIDFPMTRTDSNTSVADGKLAPGTYGELEIGIDATGSETALTYVLEGTVNNLPTNIKFYSDEERTLELNILENKFSKGGYMKLDEVGAKSEKLYWEWPFETSTRPVITDEKLTNLGIDIAKFDALIAANKFTEANDMIDTAESNMQASMLVSVTGKQLNGNPVLSDIVQVGDYVNYSANSNGTKTLESKTLAGINVVGTINSNITFNSNAKSQWRVLSVDRDKGVVELMAVEPTPQQAVKITGGDGYVNSVEILNDIGQVFGQGKGATKGRSMTIEDIQLYSSYNPYDYYNNESDLYYGDTKTCENMGIVYKETKDSNGNSTFSLVDTSSESVDFAQTFYTISIDSVTNKVISNMLFKNTTNINTNKKTYWLASRCVNISLNNCNFGINLVGSTGVHDCGVYNSSGSTHELECRIMPVVELNTNIETSGQDENGVWQLIVD